MRCPNDGRVKVVDFTLFGPRFTAMSAGPGDPFNHAISFVVNCETQDEIDRYWNALLEGGKAEQCGWLRDRFGVFWQITPFPFRSIAGRHRRRSRYTCMLGRYRPAKSSALSAPKNRAIAR